MTEPEPKAKNLTDIVDRLGEAIVDHESRKLEHLNGIRFGIVMIWTWESARTTPHWPLNLAIYLLGMLGIYWPDLRRWKRWRATNATSRQS